MQHKLFVPSTADGALSVTILKWLKNIGDPVVKGEDLIEAKTEKITLYVTAPENGTLVEIRVPNGEAARVGDELGTVEGS